jgi:hypothetical protein
MCKKLKHVLNKFILKVKLQLSLSRAIDLVYAFSDTWIWEKVDDLDYKEKFV